MADDDASFTLRLINEITKPARKAMASIKGIRDALGGVDKTAQQTGGVLRDAFSYALGQGIFEAARGVTRLTSALGTSAVEAADFAQRSLLGFEALLKSRSEATRVFNETRLTAQKLGLDVFDTTKTMQRFLALQFTEGMAKDLILAGAELRAFGATGEEVGRIMTQLGQIQSKGKLQGEELIVLAENGIGTQLVYQALERQLGKTKDEILKMQQAGKLTSDMAFPAILDAVRAMTGSPKLGAAGRKIAETTMGGIRDVLKARWQNLMTDIGQASTPALMDAVRAINAELGTLIDSSELRDGIMSTVTAVATVARDAIPYIKGFVGSLTDGFREAWPEIQQVLALLFDGFGGGNDWLVNVREFGMLLGQIAAAAAGVAIVIGGGLAAALQMGGYLVRQVTGAWGGMIEGIGKAVFAVSDFIANVGAYWERLKLDAVAAATGLIDGLIQGITGGVQRVLASVRNLGSQAMATLRNVWGSHSPSREFEDIALDAGAGAIIGFDASLTPVANAVQSVGLSALDAFAAIKPLSVSESAASSAGAVSGGSYRGGDVTIPVQRQAAGESDEAFAQRVAAIVRREMQTEMEGWALGAA